MYGSRITPHQVYAEENPVNYLLRGERTTSNDRLGNDMKVNYFTSNSMMKKASSIRSTAGMTQPTGRQTAMDVTNTARTLSSAFRYQRQIKPLSIGSHKSLLRSN